MKKKALRKIIIDGEEYVWRLRTDKYRLYDVSCLEEMVTGGLKVWKNKKVLFNKQVEWRWGESITPGRVEEIIRKHNRI